MRTILCWANMLLWSWIVGMMLAISYPANGEDPTGIYGAKRPCEVSPPPKPVEIPVIPAPPKKPKAGIEEIDTPAGQTPKGMKDDREMAKTNSMGCYMDLKFAQAKANKEGRPLFCWIGKISCENHKETRAVTAAGVNVHIDSFKGNDRPRLGMAMGDGKMLTMEEEGVNDKTAQKMLDAWKDEVQRLADERVKFAKRQAMEQAASSLPPPNQIVYQQPVMQQPPAYMMGGSGCSGGGVQMAGSGFYAPPTMMGQVVGAGGCAGQMATGNGCTSQQMMMGAGFPVSNGGSYISYSQPMSAPTEYVMAGARPVYGAGAIGAEAYYTGAAPYGARISGSQWATPTGRPSGPGIFGIPGAPWPLDGPVRRAFRAGFGYDPGGT